MITKGTLLLWLTMGLAIYGLWHAWKRFFSLEARERRRRRRNYSRAVSRRHGPTVKLAVKVDKQ